MSEALRMSAQATCEDSRNAISSQESASGHTPFAAPDGVMTDLFGLVPVRANLSARQARELARKMLDICGRFGLNSSVRASLTSFSVSRFPRHWF